MPALSIVTSSGAQQKSITMFILPIVRSHL
jgi:hypothetical protein